jgi:hypothetical protein
MTSIERTAYPRFGRLVSARELTGLSPSAEEVLWARDHARSDPHLLALVVSLKCFQRLGYFPRRDDIPVAVIDHLRRCLELPEGIDPEVGSERTGTSQHQLIRDKVGVALDPERARMVAAEAIRAAAEVKNNPPDLINVALEMTVKASLELPGFSTLDAMASQIRGEVNTSIFEQIASRLTLRDTRVLQQLLDVTARRGPPASAEPARRRRIRSASRGPSFLGAGSCSDVPDRPLPHQALGFITPK